MIRSFKHAGLEKFFDTGSKAGIQPVHAKRLQIQLTALKNASKPSDMDAPGWALHPLKAELKGHWAISVDRTWRLTFMFEGTDVIVVDYKDYH